MIVNMRYIGLLLCFGLLAQAQLQMNLEQLADFVRSELALRQHSDKQIAAGIKKLKLTERLTDKTILDLQAQGAGPKTVEALQALRDETASMKTAHPRCDDPRRPQRRTGASPQGLRRLLSASRLRRFRPRIRCGSEKSVRP